MINDQTDTRLQKTCIFIAGCLMGVLLFWITYGFKIVNPEYDSWVLASGGDLSQHYLGWLYFRKTPWTFPLGLTDGMSSDGMISCMYTDSIPLLAVFFKILSPCLPETFQYVGIWELMCYILMGGFSSLLIRRFSTNPVYCVLSSVFFISAPTILTRVLHHEALSGQWILIIGILLWTYAGHDWKYKATPVVLWSLLSILGVTVHVYFLGMTCMIMLGYVIADICRKKRILHSVAVGGFSLVSAVAAMFVFGAFYGDSGYTAAGLGNYSANYNALINSYGHSDFLEKLPVYNSNSEGFGYLGLGMLALGAAGIIIFIISFFTEEEKFTEVLISRIKRLGFPFMSAVIVGLTAFFFAASPVGTFNNQVIYEINYPEIITKFLMVFRASGRFIWVTDFIVFTVFAAAAASIRKKQIIIPVIILCLGIQMADMRSWLAHFNERYNTSDTSYDSPLKSEKWAEITENRDTFVFTPLHRGDTSAYSTYKGISEYAALHNMKMSSYYFARSNYDTLAAYAQQSLDELYNGNGMKNAVYVILHPDEVTPGENFEILEIDGYTVALAR